MNYPPQSALGNSIAEIPPAATSGYMPIKPADAPFKRRFFPPAEKRISRLFKLH